MERAVQAAHEMLGDEETLFIVTADHSHTMSIGGKICIISIQDRKQDFLLLKLHKKIWLVDVMSQIYKCSGYTGRFSDITKEVHGKIHL